MADAPGQAQVVPDVSIIIPYHNCRALTEACLDSVVAHSSGVTWELVLVDDASTDLPDLARLPSSVIVQHIRNESRKSYSANNNQAAIVARGRLLCLLNNDTVVTPGWLEAMVRVMDRLSGIGVLGNCHLYPDSGKIQHAGMAFDDTDFPLHLNPGIDRTTPAATREREFQAVTFACVMIPADTYRALHGLDESYRNGFEDVDFCLRARAAGYRVVYTPSSVIYHYGQSTPGRTVTDDANWKLFVSRWGGKVTRDLNTLGAADRAYNEQVAKRTYGKKRGESGLHLAVDVNAANAFVWATVDLAAALQRRGVPVSLPICATPHASISDANKRLLRGMMTAHPRRSYHVKWTHYWPAHFKQVLCGDVNAEFFCTNYRYREEGRRLDLWMRHVQVNEYRKLPVSRFNLEALREVGIPDSACRVMPLGYSPEIDSLFPDAGSLPSKRGKDLNLLLVTNSHDLYRYGTDLAIKALGRAYGPDDPVVVHIKDYGTPAGVDLLQQWIAEQPRFPRVVWHRTFLSKEDLIRLYAGMDVQLAPFRGEGFAMKILDAAAVGVPTLMPAFGGPTEFASEGMYIPLPFDEVPVGACYDRDHYLLGEGAYWCQVQVDPMANALRGLLDQRAVLPEMGALALSRIRKAFSWDAAAATLMSALEGWSSQRLVEVGARRHPDRRPISVIIPTKDREDILEKTLVAYQRQTLPKDAFDLVIVNDHGNLDAVKAVAAKTADLNLRILDNQGPGGPAAARNLAMGEVDGEVVLITGDDIVPGERFLAEHVEGHRRHPEMETAFVGLTLWHPDLPSTPFMDHITGEGGQQFKYDDMKHDHEVPFDRLYTSNCSLKRAFLIEEEILFSTRYRYAAFEDVEFGYRLHHRGMVLRHLATAIGYHHHEMKPMSFLERQRKVGRMLTLMAIQRPGFVPNEHWTFLRALEFFRSQPALRTAALLQEMDAEQFIQSMTRTYDHMLSLSVLLNATTGRPAVDQDAAAWKAWMTKGGVHVWEAVNQAILRQGMAEEWAMDSDDRKAACAWVQTVLMPNIASFKGADWNMPFARPEFSAFLFPQSKWAYRASKMLRSTPLLGPALLAFEQSAAGQYLRGWLARLLR
ncbi:MAG TPA: glycosyltransferase [Kiritimatiellia bacterium]|nr:glycosyltransferase [Kiritimatiellia bacterium]HMP35527.1 glycosyltransferase [Kiritimatiellia bacterium]